MIHPESSTLSILLKTVKKTADSALCRTLAETTIAIMGFSSPHFVSILEQVAKVTLGLMVQYYLITLDTSICFFQ